MRLVFFILNKEEYLEEILEALIELGINGATILDSIGMGRILAHDIPIFAGFRSLLKDSRPGNKTILIVLQQKKIQALVKAIEQIIGNLNESGNGIVFTLPIDYCQGFKSY